MKHTAAVVAVVALSESEWSEVVNALTSKIAGIERGDYGPDSEGDNKKWIATLRSAYDKITEVLDKENVPY